MAELPGTHVIAKIVTPDSEDTFATHDTNMGEGGFHQVQTEAGMLAITTSRRKAGMECRVTNDPTAEKNGRYVLQNDLVTWTKEQLDTSLGIPPDDGWGHGDQVTHTLTGVATGDSTEERWDKLLSYLDDIAPALPASLGSLILSIPNLWSAHIQGEGAHTGADNIQTDIRPTGTLNGLFGDAKSGTVKAIVNAVEQGSRIMSGGPTGDDNGTFGALTLSAEETYNGIYQRIGATIRATSALALNNVKHTYSLEHNNTSTEIDFYVDDPSQPVISGELIEGEHLSGVGFVSGVPTLKVGDVLKTSFTAANVVSWFYNLLRIARIQSTITNSVDVPLPAPPLIRGVSVNFNQVVTNVLGNVYSENASVQIIAYNARALTPIAAPSDTTQKAATSNVRIDTKSDESITVTSGQGQFPPVGAGSAGEPFNSSEDLSSAGNEELMMRGGVVLWPIANFSSNLPTPGPNYNSIAGGSFNGIRWRTFDLGSIVNKNSVTFSILAQVGFNGTPLETGNYELQLQVEGATGWLDANVAYVGAGNPVNDGDPALDVASSTISLKRVTFGTTPRSGRVLVRIGWDRFENRSFTRIE